MKQKQTLAINIFSVGFIFDGILIFSLTIALFLHFSRIITLPQDVFLILSFLGLLPVLKSATYALLKRKLTIDLLASIALIFALLTHEWYSAAFINLMLCFARLFDHWVETRTKKIIQHLLKYRPEKVKVKRDGKTLEIPIENVKVGETIVLEMGELVPVDGKIVSGKASFNEATLTGESELKVKTIGDEIYASTLNESGFVEMTAEKVGEDSRFSQVIKLIEEASKSKTSANRIADKFTFWYIFLTLLLSSGMYLFGVNLRFILSVLLVVCADDIAVAVPLCFTMVIFSAARHGVLIKGGDAVENLAKISVFITDKTGTLTRGKPKVTQIKNFGHVDEHEFLEIIASVSSDSKHPISKAITKFCEEKQIKVLDIEDFTEVPGEGVSAKFKGKQVFFGRIGFLKENGARLTVREEKDVSEIIKHGYGVIGVSSSSDLLGVVAIEDEVRKSAREMIYATKMLGIKKWIILTGDNEFVAKKVASEVNADETYFDMKPDEKVEFIKKLKKQNINQGIAMIGDGVNDAAALSLSDVSIAMGAIGSDAAIESSDVALMHDSLRRVPETIELAKAGMRTVRISFLIWGVTNAVGLVLVFAGFLGPVGASFYNFVTDFFPIFNSLRIGMREKVRNKN